MQVSGQLEGIEGMLNSQLNITNQILELDFDIDGENGVEAVFIAFLKSK